VIKSKKKSLTWCGSHAQGCELPSTPSPMLRINCPFPISPFSLPHLPQISPSTLCTLTCEIFNWQKTTLICWNLLISSTRRTLHTFEGHKLHRRLSSTCNSYTRKLQHSMEQGNIYSYSCGALGMILSNSIRTVLYQTGRLMLLMSSM
jgi:hypothetical protein